MIECEAVDPTKVYTKTHFLQIVGWKDPAFREARKDGLQVVRRHGRCYVRGCDAVAYFNKFAEEQSSSK